MEIPHIKMIYPTASTRPITVDLGQGVGGPLPGEQKWCDRWSVACFHW